MSTETAPKVQAKPAAPEAKQDNKDLHDPAHISSRSDKGEAIIRRNVLWALGAGVLPIPLVDIVAVTAVQVKMMKQLSDLYGGKFSDSVAKKIVGSLVAGLGSVGLGSALGALLAGSFAKVIPAVGTTLGLISVPVVAGAFTHATGKVFLMHFESGGTLLNFDPRAMRSFFKQEFEKAKEFVSQLQQDQAKTSTKPS